MSKKDYPRQALSTDKYETDKWLQSIFHYHHWYDPCPIDWCSELDPDGLTVNWTAICTVHHYIGVFVNPPYSNPLPWVKKAIEEWKNNTTIVLLLKHDSSTEWYRLLHEAGANMLMVNKRLKYCTNRGAAFPSVLFVLSNRSSL